MKFKPSVELDHKKTTKPLPPQSLPNLDVTVSYIKKLKEKR